MKLLWVIAAFSLLVFISSKKSSPEFFIPNKIEVPKGFDSILYPASNKYTQARWKLGKRIFFDSILSIDQSISCASCHKPELAFADTLSTTPGVFGRPGVRNVPSLINVAYQKSLLREGSVPSLEMQVLVPIQEKNEFAHNIVEIAKEMSSDSTYQEMSRKAYNRPIDPYVISRSLGVFQRALIGGTSAYDYYQYHGKEKALSEATIRGMNLFFSNKLNCSSCHSGFNFSNYKFANTGLYENYIDEGRMRFSHDSVDMAKFKVPSLRNVAITAPYMHDGSIASLEEVVQHYETGGNSHPSKSKLLKAFSLTEQEKGDLILFLNSLTDEVYLQK